MPFERVSPDKNHSWDLMRSSWPGSSDPSQTAAAAQRREPRRGQVPGLAGRARASGKTHYAGPRPRGARRLPHAPRGRQDWRAAESAGAGRAAGRGETGPATAGASATKCAKVKPKSVNNDQKEGKLNTPMEQRGEKERSTTVGKRGRTLRNTRRANGKRRKSKRRIERSNEAGTWRRRERTNRVGGGKK